MDTILLVDPHPIVTYGVNKVLQEAGITKSVVEVHTAKHALQAIDNTIALLIVDPAMSDASPDIFVEHVRRRQPDLPILFYSSQSFGIHLSLAKVLGVNGYVDKSIDVGGLLAIIRMVLAGMQCFPRREGAAGKGAAALLKLTPREMVVLQMLREGLRNKDIARRLHLSPKTVSSHKSNLMRKLGTSDIVSASLANVVLESHALNALSDKH